MGRTAIAAIGIAFVAATAWAGSRADADLAAAADRMREQSWAPAESLATAVLADAEGAAPPDTATMGRALELLADCRTRQRKGTDARGVEWGTRLLALRNAAVPPDTAAVATAEILLGRLLALQEDFASAVSHLEQGVALRRAIGAESDSLVAEARLQLGVVQRRAHLVDEARATLSGAIAAYAPGRKDDDFLVAQARMELAGSLALLQQQDEARHQYQAALRAYRARFGEGPELGVIYDGLSQVEKFDGNLAQSLEWLEHSIDVKTRGYGADARSTLISRANLGGRLIEFGDAAGARRCLEPLVKPFEDMYGPGHSITEQVRTQLGVACLATGDAAAARAHLEASLAAMKERPGDHASMEAWTLRWLARTSCVEGDLKAARRLDDRALEVAGGLEEGEPAMLVEIHTDRMAVLGVLGETAALPAAIDSTSALIARRGMQDSQFGVLARAEQARAMFRLGRQANAWETALASDASARRLLLANAGQLSERNALALSGQWSDALPLLVRLALRGAPADPAVAWDRAQKWRGWWERERELHRSPRTGDRDVLRAHGAWVSAEREYGRAIVDRSRGADDAPDDAALDAARQRAERAEAGYRRVSREVGVQAPAPEPELGEIVARLAPDEALVSYALAASGPDDPETLAAFVVRGGGGVAVVDLGPMEAARAQLATWRRLLATPPGARIADAEAECRRAGEAVRAMVWDPLARWVDDASTVHVVDGALQDVPWLALPSGTAQYLAENGPRLRVHEAERDLLREPAPARKEIVLALGDPDFDRSSGGTRAVADIPGGTMFRGGVSPCTAFPHLIQLPAAGREAQEVAKLLSRNPRVRTGADADEARFKSEAPGCTVLHLATHGVVLADTCASAGATGGAPGTRGVGGVEPVSSRAEPVRSRWAQVATGENTGSPWLGRRVWLALAGANRARAAEDDNDGMLTAEDVVTMDLRDADWVVLSACHSGSLESWSREGALGMTRALHLAGARTVISSRWSLEDESAREWMRALYRARARGERSGGAALQDACQSVLAARRAGHRTTHPFYWASFTASGD